MLLVEAIYMFYTSYMTSTECINSSFIIYLYRHSVDSWENEGRLDTLSQVTPAPTCQTSSEVPSVLLLILGRCSSHCLQR